MLCGDLFCARRLPARLFLPLAFRAAGCCTDNKQSCFPVCAADSGSCLFTYRKQLYIFVLADFIMKGPVYRAVFLARRKEAAGRADRSSGFSGLFPAAARLLSGLFCAAVFSCSMPHVCGFPAALARRRGVRSFSFLTAAIVLSTASRSARIALGCLCGSKEIN